MKIKTKNSINCLKKFLIPTLVVRLIKFQFAMLTVKITK